MSENSPSKHSGLEATSARRLLELKKLKTRSKSAFTRTKNKLLALIDDEEISRKRVRELQSAFDRAQDEYAKSLDNLAEFYEEEEETEEQEYISEEMEKMDEEYTNTHKRVQDSLDSIEVTPNISIGKDLWKQMRRVSIPVFNGDKRKYESWKSAFMACVDAAPATGEYKLLQLRQYLEGEALKSKENLGHSEMAYTAAKERLERKFGGKKRQVQLFLEELNNFPIMKEENAKNIENFADLLDIAVINLSEAGRDSDLGDGALYLALQKKLPLSMLARYHRWIHEIGQEESVKSLREWILLESQFKTSAAETIFGLQPKGKNVTSHFTSQKSKKEMTCKLCNASHGIWHCESFKQLPVQERWEKAKSLSLCFRCLGDRHFGRGCRFSRPCGINNCNKSHNRLLHQSEIQQSYPSTINVVENNDIHTTCTTHREKCYVGLRTIPVYIVNGNKQLKINALLDDGSTQSYINTSVAMALGIPIGHFSETMTVNVLNGRSESFQSHFIEVGIKSLNEQLNMNLHVKTIENVTGKLHALEINKYSRSWEHLKGIEFPTIGNNQHIDMLIGLDYSDLHQSLHEVRGKPGEPVARLTPLGWTCVGNFNPEQSTNSFMCHTFLLSSNSTKNSELNETLRHFWEVEEVIKSNPISVKDRLLLENTENSIQKDNNKYVVSIPWNEKKSDLTNNYEMAEKRLSNTEKRLKRNPDLYDKYDEIFQKYCEKGYISEVNNLDTKTVDSWYIPHFPIIRPDKSTTKIRIVFDASAKFQGLSLNNAINQGPPLQSDLFDILTRFRRHSVAVVCDIQEMYLQVGISLPDRKYHRFLWRSRSDGLMHIYEFNRLVFGVNASPFLAQCVSRYNAELYREELPLAAETVLNSTYMDDSIDSVKDSNTGIDLYNQLSELWRKAGMFARKWLSNSKEVLKHIPPQDRAFETDLSKNELQTVKTLGVLWQSDIDCFQFRFNNTDNLLHLTKRNFLSKIATIYDPLGFLVPYTVRAKMLMQEIWCGGTDWDEELPQNLMSECQSWYAELPDLKDIKINRNLQYSECEDSQIHTFVDASTKAICAVVYIRNEQSNLSVSTNIIAAKSKVVPLKSISVPRLELMAAVLGLNLSEKVCKSLEYKMAKVQFWSDSLNTLYWIRNQSRQFKPFVANRLGEIHSITNPEQWRYVPSQQNPADFGSRGLTVKELNEQPLWWKGSEFLCKEFDMWPENRFSPEVAANVEQKRNAINNYSVSFVSHPQSDDNFRLNPKRFSSWSRLLRVYAWVLRFLNNCQLPDSERLKEKFLNVEEMKSTENIIISQTQQKHFPEEYISLCKGRELTKNSKIVKLNSKLDEEGLIRSDSRLKYIEFVPYDTRCPIILPRKDWVTKLIVGHHHNLTNHGGTNQTLASLSARYWIIAAREEIRELKNECLVCRRHKAKTAQQIMGPIPGYRAGKTMRAFAHTAVDYADPFLTKQGRGKTRNKRYLCVFTCMSCRAVHLELSYSLDTDSFMNTFYRFVSRRGLPETVVSDNGTNFVGAVRELKELFSLLDRDKISQNAANRGIQWHFIPPNAPHFGGVHESMVKCAKRAIYAILTNADVNDEELQTVISGAEGLINTRPLTYQTTNPNDEPVLTPNHFLHGQIGGQFAPESVDLTSYDIRQRWRRVQELVKHFWNRWFREFLPTLGLRKKWHRSSRDFCVGDVVMVVDPDARRGEWKLGRITQTFPGPDNRVRVVNVQNGNKVLKRPITRLCLIEENQCKLVKEP